MLKPLPLKRASTPLQKVATSQAPKRANGRVILVGNVRTVAKHPPYNPRLPVTCVYDAYFKAEGTALGQRDPKRSIIFTKGS